MRVLLVVLVISTMEGPVIQNKGIPVAAPGNGNGRRAVVKTQSTPGTVSEILMVGDFWPRTKVFLQQLFQKLKVVGGLANKTQETSAAAPGNINSWKSCGQETKFFNSQEPKNYNSFSSNH